MKKEIRDKFDSLGLETKKLIDRCPHKLDRDEDKFRKRIECGMIDVYKRRYEEGEDIKDISMARQVWASAYNENLKYIRNEYEENVIVELKRKLINSQETSLAGWIIAGALLFLYVFAILQLKEII